VSQVNVTVNGRQYSVGCQDGEEEHIAYLAEYVDNRMRELAGSVGQVGETRLLLMTALLVADDLATAYDEAEAMKGELEGLRGDAAKARRASPRLGDIARRLEAVAARLATPAPAP